MSTTTRPIGPVRTRRLVRWAAWAVVGPLLAVGAITVDPARFGLSTTPGFLHLVSFRGPAALGFGAAGAGVLLTLMFPRPRRPWLRIVAGTVLLSVGLAHGGVVLARGWHTPAAAGKTDLVVVSLNTLKGSVSAHDLATLVDGQAGSDRNVMVSLPETRRDLAERTAAELRRMGREFQVFSTPDVRDKAATTSMLVSTELGPYRQEAVSYMFHGAVRAVPADGTGPTLVAVHTGAPVPGVGYPEWASYVTTAVQQCRVVPNAVVAGDFNATLDHAPMQDLGDCQDAAAAAGRGAEGTWPSTYPSALASPIDHVLVDEQRYRVLGTHTIRVAPSDHRALIARLQFIPAAPRS